MSQKGFTLIEIMLVILLLGIIASIGIPTFLRSGLTPTEEFIGRLNASVQDAVLLADEKHTVQKVFFDISGKKVDVQTTTGAVYAQRNFYS